MNKTTIKDVAREAGVSITTVSLALNNSPKVLNATKTKVLNAAKKLQYVKNGSAARLRQLDSKSALILVHESSFIDMPKLHSTQITLTKTLEEMSYSVSFGVIDDMSVYRKLKWAEINNFSLIIIFSSTKKHTFYNLIKVKTIIISHLNKYNENFICLNYREMAKMLINLLNEMNHRYACIINTSNSMPIKIANAIIRENLHKVINLSSIHFLDTKMELLSDKINTLMYQSPQISAFIFTDPHALNLTRSIIKNNNIADITASENKLDFILCNSFNYDTSLSDYEICFSKDDFIYELLELIKNNSQNNNSVLISPTINKTNRSFY